MSVNGNTPNSHRQVASRAIPGAELDSGIASLVDWLNESGCPTVFSCQGAQSVGPWLDGCGYIMFDSARGLERALSLMRVVAADAGEYALSTRVAGLPSQEFPHVGLVLAGWAMQWRFELLATQPPAHAGQDVPLRAVLRAAHEDLVQLNRLLEARSQV